MRFVALMLTILLTPTPALAEVKSIVDNGFEVTRTVIVKADPKTVYASLGRVSKWWNAAHTYSGDARNLKLGLRAGACFCETIPADMATVEHGRVIFAQPGKTLRLQTALGPLQPEGAIGALTWSIKPVSGGSEITQLYVVGGYIRGGTKVYAPLVDQVLSEQLARLVSYLNAS